MLRLKPLLFSLIAPFLLVSSFASWENTLFPTTYQTSGVYGKGNGEAVVSWSRIGRFLAENSSDEQVNTTLLLAADRTARKDPLDNFDKYRGGWNINNRHYWASVAYTAAPFFIIGAIWFLIFGLSLTVICLYYCCCRREPYGYSRIASLYWTFC